MKKASRTAIEPKFTQDEADGSPARIIPLRSETVFSRRPIHRLSKKTSIEIKETRRTEHGNTTSVWTVRNPPGPLSYKVDSLVITRRIEESRPNVPKLLRLGSLSEMCRELGMADSGKNRNDLKEAIHQNASAYIIASIEYNDKDGVKRKLEFGSSRYGVFFVGETLPNGKKADAVYVHFHDSYLSLIHHAPTRPLDYEYSKQLPPAAQRLYELVSFIIFGSLRHGRSHATMLYSELCAAAPLTRYYQWEQAKKQLYKIHKPHIESGYLKAVGFEQTTEANGRLDWIIRYTPGPKAKREFNEFTRKRERSENAQPAPRLVPAALPVSPDDGPDCVGTEDSALVTRLVAAGMAERTARKLAATHRGECERQLEALPFRDLSGVRNRTAWLIKAITDGYAPPTESEGQRVRAEAQQRANQAEAEQKTCEEHREKFLAAYHDYLRPERSRIERKHAEEYKRFAAFIAEQQRLLKNLTPAHREAIELGFFEEFIEERPELGVMTFGQWVGMAHTTG